jgi:hypothetical protein
VQWPKCIDIAPSSPRSSFAVKTIFFIRIFLGDVVTPFVSGTPSPAH